MTSDQFKRERLKLSPLFISIMMVTTTMVANANQTPNDSVSTVSGKVVSRAEEAKKTETAPNKVQFSGQSNSNIFPLTHNMRQGAGRFGENRNGRSHGGVDISPKVSGKPEQMVAINSGKVVYIGGKTNALTIKLDNGDQVAYLHNKINNVKVGDKVAKGQPIAVMGNAGTTPVHLHLSYGVPKKHAFSHHLQVQNVANTYKNSSALKALILHGNNHIQPHLTLTNPAPYLPEDVAFIFGSANDNAMTPYLGNTMRTQWNALYSEVTGITLPTSSCIQVRSNCLTVKQGKKFPKAALINGQVGNMDAYATANAAIAQGLADGSIPSEYANKDYVSPAEISRYLKPRTIFGGSAEDVALDVGDFNLSPSQQIEKIGNSRFGNEEWAKNLMQMSMRGMLTEYLNMTTANNYLVKEQFKQKERLEALLAAYTAQRAQRFSGYVDRAYAAAETAKVNAAVSTMPLEKLFSEEFDHSGVIDSEQYGQILGSATGGVPRVCKGGIQRHTNLQKYPELLPGIKKLALKYGINPNDLAAVMGFESGGFNPKGQNQVSSGTGLFQWVPVGIADISQKDFEAVGLYPKYKPQKSAKGWWGFGSDHRKVILSMSVTEQLALSDAYLNMKVQQNKRWRAEYGDIALKDIRHLYPLVLGNTTFVSPSANYTANSGMDSNKDGKITPAEAATSSKFHPYLCQYFPDFP